MATMVAQRVVQVVLAVFLVMTGGCTATQTWPSQSASAAGRGDGATDMAMSVSFSGSTGGEDAASMVASDVPLVIPSGCGNATDESLMGGWQGQFALVRPQGCFTLFRFDFICSEGHQWFFTHKN